MSRIGRLPINIPAGVTVSVGPNNLVVVKGQKGTLERKVDPDIEIKVEGNVLSVLRPSDSKRHKALQGLYRALIANMVHGVSVGYKIEQELVGVGYRASNSGQLLELSLGFSHNVVFEIPKEVKVETKSEKGKNPTIILSSADKELIGLVAAKIRSLRKPEPYKGKGVIFSGEVLRRKAGKSTGK